MKSFGELAGKNLLIGEGGFGASEGGKYLELFGQKDNVPLSNAELNRAVAGLNKKQIDGFATAGSYPVHNAIEAAADGDHAAAEDLAVAVGFWRIVEQQFGGAFVAAVGNRAASRVEVNRAYSTLIPIAQTQSPRSVIPNPL